MIAWIIVAVVAVPLVVIAFMAMHRRSSGPEEQPAGAADATLEEQEFDEAERYQAEWREQTHKHQDDTLIP